MSDTKEELWQEYADELQQIRWQLMHINTNLTTIVSNSTFSGNNEVIPIVQSVANNITTCTMQVNRGLDRLDELVGELVE